MAWTSASCESACVASAQAPKSSHLRNWLHLRGSLNIQFKRQNYSTNVCTSFLVHKSLIEIEGHLLSGSHRPIYDCMLFYLLFFCTHSSSGSAQVRPKKRILWFHYFSPNVLNACFYLLLAFLSLAVRFRKYLSRTSESQRSTTGHRGKSCSNMTSARYENTQRGIPDAYNG